MHMSWCRRKKKVDSERYVYFVKLQRSIFCIVVVIINKSSNTEFAKMADLEVCVTEEYSRILQ